MVSYGNREHVGHGVVVSGRPARPPDAEILRPQPHFFLRCSNTSKREFPGILDQNLRDFIVLNSVFSENKR